MAVLEKPKVIMMVDCDSGEGRVENRFEENLKQVWPQP